MTQKGKLKILRDILIEKKITRISNFQIVKLLADFYEVKEKTAREYLHEMVTFGFLERPLEGSDFLVK